MDFNASLEVLTYVVTGYNWQSWKKEEKEAPEHNKSSEEFNIDKPFIFKW
jgi:hypothetical protein